MVYQTVPVEIDVPYNLLEVDLLGKARILSTEHVGFGLAIGFAVGHTEKLEQTYVSRLNAPANARFVTPIDPSIQVRDNGRTLVFLENEPIENASSTRFSMRSGMFFEVGLFDRLHITPGVYFDYPLTPVVRESTWRLKYTMFQLDVMARL